MNQSPSGPPPQAVMMQMISGKCISRCISAVADLGIADHLEAGPRDAASLAAETGVQADPLYRVMRMLAGLGVFHERADQTFENSPLSDALRNNAQGSVRHYARWYGQQLHWRIWADFDFSLQTGKPSIHKSEPDKTPFEVIAEDSRTHQVFQDAMTGLSLADGAAIIGAYDFSRFVRIADIGGGHGMLARMIADAAPEAEVTVFDLPHVVEETRREIEKAGLADRIHVAGGSFFEAIPGPFDLCVFKHIIHDWDDETAATILRNCAKALADGGRVVLCEMLITPGPESLPALLLDVEMLAGPGGRERTRDEFAALFAAAGFRLERVIETQTPIRLVEASLAR